MGQIDLIQKRLILLDIFPGTGIMKVLKKYDIRRVCPLPYTRNTTQKLQSRPKQKRKSQFLS